MSEPFRIGTILLEIMFLVVLGRYAWKQRSSKFVFWGTMAVIAMLAVVYVYFDWFPK